MGLFNKIKNIFYDVEEVEEVKKEETAKEETKIEEKEIPSVKISPIEEPTNERELFKSKNTFNFPIFDSEEEDIKPEIPTRIKEPEFEVPRREIRRENNFNETVNTNNNGARERKLFTPTPVISPVYGILDKNYKKEEINPKKEVYHVKESDKNYDYVRRKAYGTLEDELENTLTHINYREDTIEEMTSDLTETIQKIEESSKNIEDLLTEIETNKVTIDEIEEGLKDRIEKEEKETKIDNTLEHDLFNLIDSMYEDKEE